MEIAVFSDIHGNLTGLESILSDIKGHQPDEVVVAGDLCMMGARPAECLELIRSRHFKVIYGNTDEWLLGRQKPPPHLEQAAEWTADRLTKEARTWLAQLPFQIRFSPTGAPKGDLLIVHANPIDVNRIIFPPEEQQQALYGRVRQADNELGSILADTEAAVLAFGHLHIPSVRVWGKMKLVNISSVSLPGDGDPRAKYSILTWNNGSWHIDQYHVSYDLEAEVDALHQNPIPGWEEAMQTLERQRFIPQRV
jgi:predicted phosphodiesterase